MKIKQEIKRYARKVKGKLTTVFAPEHLEALARQSEFIQRSSSKLAGKDFVELMTTEMIEDPAISLEGLCAILGDLNPHAEMTPQALHQRINPYAVSYLQEVFQLALRQQLEPICERLPVGALAPFGRVLLEDSTQCRLHEKLAETFKATIRLKARTFFALNVVMMLWWVLDMTHRSTREAGRNNHGLLLKCCTKNVFDPLRSASNQAIKASCA